jgi:hypothetical protein
MENESVEPLYSFLTNVFDLPHFGHFLGLQRASFVSPQAEHFQFAMINPFLRSMVYDPSL